MSGYVLKSLDSIPLTKEQYQALRNIHATWLASQETQDLTWELFHQESNQIKNWSEDNDIMINIGEYKSEPMYLNVRIIHADSKNIFTYFPYGKQYNMSMINDWIDINIIHNRNDIKNHTDFQKIISY